MMKMNAKKFGILSLLILSLLAVVIIAVVLISRHVGSLISRIEEAPVEEVMPEEVVPPTSDVTGKNIPDVPRYPGSVRAGYLHFDDERARRTTVVYITPASIDEVLRFYKKELPANGWIDIIEMQEEDTFFLVGYKEGASAQVHIGPDEYYPDHTSIGLVNTEYKNK
jgi:hypothetical protein